MNLHILKTDQEYQELLDWVDAQFDLNAAPDSKAGEDLQVALLLMKQYEDVHFPIPKPDPLLVVKQKMEEEGLKNKEDLTINTFTDYIVSNLGNAICNKFVKPYNQKLYACDLDQLDFDAMGRFFPKPLDYNSYSSGVNFNQGIFHRQG